MVRVKEIPTEANAMQFKGANIREIIAFGGEAVQFAYGEQGFEVFIESEGSKSNLDVNDWIVKYDDGRMRAVTNDMFKLLYTVVDD